MQNLSDDYSRLEPLREPFLSRGKDYAKMTVKQLLDKNEDQGSESKSHGYTSLGAKLVNHLANKVVMTLFPIGHNFFIPKPNAESQIEMKQQGVSLSDLQPSLLAAATAGREHLGTMQDRQTQIEIAKHLIVAGNIAKYYPPKGRCILIPLHSYVVERDPQEKIVTFIWKQEKAFGRLSQKAKAAFLKGRVTRPKPSDKVKIFTGVKLLDSGDYLFVQEINDIQIERRKIREDQIPFDALRWSKTSGDAYGHSHVEEHAADLFTYRFLTKCISKGMALMCDVKYLVRGGMTNIEHLMKSEIGGFVAGNLDDIGVLQLGKYADYSQVQVVREEFKRELGQAFLMNSAVRRDAERVTTYELRLDAAELESAMGGIYSLLAEEWQKPLAMRIMQRISPKMAKNADYSIVTGLETLGQASELDKIAQFSQLMQLPSQWPAPVQGRVKWKEYTQTVSNSIALELPWLMTEEEYEKQQKAQAEAMRNQQLQQGMADAIPTVAQPFAQQAAGM